MLRRLQLQPVTLNVKCPFHTGEGLALGDLQALGLGGLRDLAFQGREIRLVAFIGVIAQNGDPVGGRLPDCDILGAQIQAEGSGDHDQHHGGENANVGQAHGVALHAVEHAGHGDEMLGLVVVPFVFLQNL